MADFDPSAERLIRRARSALLRNKPAGRGGFFGQLAMRLDLQAAADLKTPVATDGRVLRYRPDAIKALSPEHLLSLVGQAVIQCSLGHHTRRGKRNPDLYRMASQFVANPELQDAGFALPPDALIDDRFRDMAIERVYTILEQEMPPQGGGQGEGQGEGGGQKKKKQRSQSQNDGSNGSQPEDATRDPNENGEDGEGGEGGDKDNGDRDRDGSGRPLTAEELERERREWQMAAVQAAAAAQRQGTMPGFAERYLTALARPKIDPWSLLRELCKETIKTDYQFLPPNRRFITSGYYFPSIRSDEAMGEMVVAIDTSGSIDDRTLQEFAKHIGAIKTDYRPKKLYVLFCDSQIARVQVFEPDEELVLQPAGGGGTDFRPPFAWVEKNMDGVRPVCLVYLTDGEGPAPSAAPDYPVIWCVIEGGRKQPFGHNLFIPA